MPYGDLLSEFPAIIRKRHLKALIVQPFPMRTVIDSFSETTISFFEENGVDLKSYLEE